MVVEAFLQQTKPKITVEKPVKKRLSIAELTTVESPGRPSPADMLEESEEPKKSTKRKISRKTAKSDNIKIEKSRGNAILIITEKPQAAMKIANAIGEANKYAEDGISYYEIDRENRKIYVASAVGHLFNLNYKEGQKGWPIYELEWIPSFNKKNSAFTKKYYSLLKKLAQKSSEFIVATDFDTEGEVIGWNILRFICNQRTAKRMKFSTLTQGELKKSFESPLQELAWGNAYAGESRHYLDWLYGINLSRALMSAIKTSGSFKILSIGRVQGPALKIIVDKEHEISAFKPEPYWQVFAQVKNPENKKEIIELKHFEDIFDKALLDRFKNIKEGIAETKSREEHIPPPSPFDLTSLQREAYRLHKISPSETLHLAQQLYIDGIISYPRTSSQKIPKEIEPKKILKALEKHFPAAKNITRTLPIEGKKSDPAHPSIYPTGEYEKIQGNGEKLYNLIAKRFISCFSSDAITSSKRITLTALDSGGNQLTYEASATEVEDEKEDKKEDNDEEIENSNENNKEKKNAVDNKSKKRTIAIKFAASGLKILDAGWTSIYPMELMEFYLPDLNGKVKIDKIKIEEKETQPPRRFTPTSLISLLEKKRMGTKSTRSTIVDTLFQRGYLDGTSIKATDLGIRLIDTLKKYSPIIINEELTRKLEEEMEKIQESNNPKELEKKENEIVEEAKKLINEISIEFKKNETKIGKDLLEGITKEREDKRIANALQLCSTCKKGNLRIMYNRSSRRYFVSCSAYPECRQTFSLPPNALIRKTDNNKLCEFDQFPKLLAIRKGKRPWEFCFNPECEIEKKKREEWVNKKKGKYGEDEE